MKFSPNLFSKLIILVFLVFVSACNFNKVFLKPNKFQEGFKEFSIKTPTDTLHVYFSGPAHQPTFMDKDGRDTSKLDFTIESVVFKSSNGDTLNGWFLKPLKQEATITLFHLHGNSGSVLGNYKAVSPLIKNGFQIFIFDYSGFGFSQGKATRKNALTDALSAFDYIKTRQDVKNTKLVIYGQSFGGHLSAVVAAKRQKEIDALVMEGAFSSAQDIGAYHAPIIARILLKQGYRATKSIKKYTKPVLIIHSTEDKTVPFYMGQKIYKKANSPKEFYEIKKCHICGPRYYTDEISEKIKFMLR